MFWGRAKKSSSEPCKQTKKPILWGYVLFTVLSIGTNIVPRKKYLYERGSIEKPALSEILDMTYWNS